MLTGFTPEKEIEDDLADANMALLARLLSKGLKQFKFLMDQYKTTMLVINQIRAKPGVTYGNPETLSAGNALKYYSDIIIRMSKIKTIEKGKESIGIISKMKAMKNRCHIPFREKELYIRFPYEKDGKIVAGIDLIEDVVPEAITQGIIAQKGAYYTWKGFPEDPKSKSNTIYKKESVTDFFNENPELIKLLIEDLLNNTNNTYDNTTEDNSEEEDYSEEEAT